MADATFVTADIFKLYILPFLLVFFILYALLAKSKILGENKQINALVSFVIGLIFIGFLYPKQVVSNLVVILVLGIIILFIFLILYGFALGGKEDSLSFFSKGWLKWFFFILIGLAVIIGTLWAAGINTQAYDFLFNQSWSKLFWTNVLLIGIIVVALAVVMKSQK